MTLIMRNAYRAYAENESNPLYELMVFTYLHDVHSRCLPQISTIARDSFFRTNEVDIEDAWLVIVPISVRCKERQRVNDSSPKTPHLPSHLIRHHGPIPQDPNN